MLGTSGNTFRLLRISWRILMSDKELLLLPLMCGGALLLVFVYAAGALWAGGTLERIGPDYRFHLADFVFLALAYFVAAFLIVYFEAALIAGAYARLEGWEADIRTSLSAAGDRLGAIFSWSAIASSFGFVLAQLADGRSLIGRATRFAVRVIWDQGTYFVLPALIVEGLSPVDALARSTEIFHRRWGSGVVANFAFGLAYVLIFFVALALGAAVFFGLGAPMLAAVLGGALFAFGVAAVHGMETVFRVALYEFAATGRAPEGYTPELLDRAYVTRDHYRGGRTRGYAGRATW